MANLSKRDRYGGYRAVGDEEINANAIPFERITGTPGGRVLQAVTASATHIATGNTVVFISRSSHGVPAGRGIPKWCRARFRNWTRLSTRLHRRRFRWRSHRCALMEPPYCDGGLRQNVPPLSPACHLGPTVMIVVRPGGSSGEIQKIPERPNPSQDASPMFRLARRQRAPLFDRVETTSSGFQRIKPDPLAGQKQFGDDSSAAAGTTRWAITSQRWNETAVGAAVRASK